MKSSLSLALAFVLLGVQANAQSTNTSTASAANGSTSTGSSDARLRVSYSALMFGPGVDMSAAKTAGGGDFFISHRPKFAVAFGSSGIDTGLQLRIRTTNTTQAEMGVTNENYRIFANFRNVAKFGATSLTLTPRIILPTSNNAWKTHLLPSPELIASFDINPKNSRFSFSVAPQIIASLYHSNKAEAGNSLVYFVGNLESTYAINDKVQVTAGFYPSFDDKRGEGFVNDGDELDLGVNYDFAKGWSINPYFATEMLNVANGANVAKNTSINLTLNGTFL